LFTPYILSVKPRGATIYAVGWNIVTNPKIMGDKSPKAVGKKSTQKQTKATAVVAKKKAAVAAKKVVSKK